MRSQPKYHRRRAKNFTQEEKRNYYLQWKRSGQKKAVFCQSQGIIKSTFYAWCQEFKQERPSEETIFSPVTLKSVPTMIPENIINLEIILPNLSKINIPMQKSNVVSFIQELYHAVTVIR